MCLIPNPEEDKLGKHLHENFDAMVWANEFRKIFPEMDLATMHCWFANAIMCGFDHGKRERSPVGHEKGEK